VNEQYSVFVKVQLYTVGIAKWWPSSTS